MIELDTSALLSSLAKYKAELKLQLEAAVRKFSYLISYEAIHNTPLGDSNYYRSAYLQRQQSSGLQPIEGYARGSWQVSSTGSFRNQELYSYQSGDQAAALIESDLSDYRLGQDVYIGNNAYYIKVLEGNHSLQTSGLGIMAPTMDKVMQIYSISMQDLLKV